MARASQTQIAHAARRVREEREWMEKCGGTREGYIAKYGSKDDPEHSGEGGEAIYVADLGVLLKAEANLRALEAKR